MVFSEKCHQLIPQKRTITVLSYVFHGFSKYGIILLLEKVFLKCILSIHPLLGVKINVLCEPGRLVKF